MLRSLAPTLALLLLASGSLHAGPVVEGAGLKSPVLAYLVQISPPAEDGTIEVEAAFEAGYDLETLRVRVIASEGVELADPSPRFVGSLGEGRSHARRFRVRLLESATRLPATLSLFVEYRFPFEPVLRSLMASPLGQRPGPEREVALEWAKSLQGEVIRDVHTLSLP